MMLFHWLKGIYDMAVVSKLQCRIIFYYNRVVVVVVAIPVDDIICIRLVSYNITLLSD